MVVEPAHRDDARVAFLTPEFATEKGATGGVGNYVLKMALALAERGTESEVFVPSDQPGVVAFQGIRVERVARDRNVALRGTARLLRPRAGPQAEVLIQLANARRLAAALRRRHAERPFGVVQSSNYHLPAPPFPASPAIGTWCAAAPRDGSMTTATAVAAP